MICEQRNIICELRDDAIQQLFEELRQALDQIDALVYNLVFTALAQLSLIRVSYADVARIPPSSQPSGLHTLSSPNTTSPTLPTPCFIQSTHPE
ncbi:hypothetical protein N657DRAFT_702533 [Parathielavia appendiculata]|uniref:Uncharacterized protein n=1 Tax=Parathielavia appendiculata TaxID=2587402 RepID=A0AAN6TTN9_9PEZI|nr:hypothetical protein N657DRAFT_702533 [Parathielavia appendiculata]